MKGTGKGQAEEIRGHKNMYFQTPFKHVFKKQEQKKLSPSCNFWLQT